MNKIEKNSLDKLLQIIEPIPMQTITHFSCGGMDMIHMLRDFSFKLDYEYRLNCTNAELYDKVKNLEHAVVKNFPIARPNYLIQGKFSDYLFVTIYIEDEEKEMFLKKAHRSIKNAGLILLFVQKDSLEQIDLWNRLLEENNFVATSSIDLFEHYDIIISKKMHGWGG